MHCNFGLAAWEEAGRFVLEGTTPQPFGAAFLQAHRQADLLAAFLRSEAAYSLERLTIGTSSDCRGDWQLDYSAAVAELATGDLPYLKSLSLGDHVLFSNSHNAYGKLGNITETLHQHRHIQRLKLWGNFEITDRLEFPHLKTLYVQCDDVVTNINGGPLSQETVTNLLNAQMPELEIIFLRLQCLSSSGGFSDAGYSSQLYELPWGFLEGINVPMLFELAIDREVLSANEEDRIGLSPLVQRPGFHLDIWG